MSQTSGLNSQFRCNILCCTGIFLLWGSLFLALVPTWKYGLYYDYGWFVPPAALIFAWGRIRDRRERGEAFECQVSSSGGWFFFLCVLVAGLFSVRALEYVDITWRRSLIPHAALVAVASFAILWFCYGRKIALYLSPVIVFALTAVPLPSTFEYQLAQTFADGVIAVGASVLRLLGMPITVQGTVLHSTGGMVEVVEGCTGLRSFQSLFMAAMFFGELYRFSLRSRLGLIVAGVTIGFLANVLRVIVLAQLSLKHGEGAFDRWHDTVGNAAFAVSIACLFGLACIIDNRIRRGRKEKPSAAEPDTERESAGRSATTAGLVSLVAALVLVEIGVALWFRVGPTTSPETVRAPEHNIAPGAKVEELDLSSNWASTVMNYDEGSWLRVSGADGRPKAIEFFSFRFEPENVGYFEHSLGHQAENCMSSKGGTVDEEFPTRELELPGGQRLRFRSIQTGAGSGTPTFIFKTRWIGEHGSVATPSPTTYRIRAAIERRKRPTGAAVIMMAGVSGCDTEEDAWKYFVEQIFSLKA